MKTKIKCKGRDKVKNKAKEGEKEKTTEVRNSHHKCKKLRLMRIHSNPRSSLLSDRISWKEGLCHLLLRSDLTGVGWHNHSAE